MAPLRAVVDDLLAHHVAELDEEEELQTPVELVCRFLALVNKR